VYIKPAFKIKAILLLPCFTNYFVDTIAAVHHMSAKKDSYAPGKNKAKAGKTRNAVKTEKACPESCPKTG
jgi:hypothetical protein